ncbi:MAG TPA: hypothetical protein VG273_21900 [Bryobacteraceae bacterium]|jgi:hypothetical protein|nr:hypothetical protein [Bryobacteraceae bacterium]
MPRINRRRRRRLDSLTSVQELALIIGQPDGFETPEARREAWFTHRDRLMALMGPGVRPQAFWEYEGHKRHRGEKSVDALRRLGLLTENEERIISL